MAAGDCYKVILMSDGRFSGEDAYGNWGVISEDFRKIKRIQNNLYIAFAGHVKDCNAVITATIAQTSTTTTVEEYTDIIVTWIESNADYKHTDFNAQIIVVGLNSFGRLKINVVRCFNHALTTERNNLLSGPRFTVCSPLDPSDDFVTPLMNQGKDLFEQMKEVVIEAAKRDRTINDHIAYEVITSPQ